MRTPDEVKARIAEIKTDDFLGFRREVLMSHLPFEAAHEYLKDEVTEADWEPEDLDDASLIKDMANYMEFAWGKVLDHRGISAERSVQKIGEYLWLLGDSETLIQFHAATYPNYGAPKLLVACNKYELPVPSDPRARRMAEGLGCRALDDPQAPCDEGCGR